MVLEALANVIVGGIGRAVTGHDSGLPIGLFAASGFTQVCAKAFTNLALSHSVSFPVVTLAKSGKMVPVMIGSILLGGSKYSFREYVQVLMIIGGTCIVSLAKKSKSAQDVSSTLGVAFVALSLICDGLTGGLQKRLKQNTIEMGVKIKSYDMMFWTNGFMMLSALMLSIFKQELIPGFNFLVNNPSLLTKIASFAACSAMGQTFIFFTLANFEPLVCTTVTTTRKIFSVLLSIFVNKHQLNSQGWAGIGIACLGILGELQHKASSK
jgi:UDP-galactose transporter B1